MYRPKVRRPQPRREAIDSAHIAAIPESRTAEHVHSSQMKSIRQDDGQHIRRKDSIQGDNRPKEWQHAQRTGLGPAHAVRASPRWRLNQGRKLLVGLLTTANGVQTNEARVARRSRSKLVVMEKPTDKWVHNPWASLADKYEDRSD